MTFEEFKSRAGKVNYQIEIDKLCCEWIEARMAKNKQPIAPIGLNLIQQVNAILTKWL